METLPRSMQRTRLDVASEERLALAALVRQMRALVTVLLRSIESIESKTSSRQVVYVLILLSSSHRTHVAVALVAFVLMTAAMLCKMPNGQP